MATRLPVIDGWTVDCRLSQFRKVKFNKAGEPSMEYADFDSTKGRKLIKRIGYKKFRRACGNPE